MGLHADSGRVEERWAPRGSLDDRTCAARAWHSAGRAARDTMANVCAGALAGTRRCRLLHNRGVDHARTRDVLHRIPDRIAVPPCTDPGLDAVSGRSIRHPMPAASHERARRHPTETTDPSLRSRSEMEQRGRAVALEDGCSRYPNAAWCAELQRVCGTVYPVGKGGMPSSCRPAGRMAPSSDSARVRRPLPS